MQCFLLYFVTRNAVLLIKKKLKDGKIISKDQVWDAEKVRPYFYETKSFFGFKRNIHPLYIVTGDNAKPYRFDFKEKGSTLEDTMTPANYKNIFKQEALKEVLKPSGPKGMDMFMYIIIGAVMGGLFGFILAGMAP